MSEIKFRVWDGNRMTSQIRLEFAHGLRLVSTDDLGFGMIGDDKCILMQYTGLKDKNGKEIYEGDIVEWSVYEDAQDTASGEEEKSRWKDSIYFSNGCFALEKRKELLFNFLAPHRELEIIGNIYENPELIK